MTASPVCRKCMGLTLSLSILHDAFTTPRKMVCSMFMISRKVVIWMKGAAKHTCTLLKVRLRLFTTIHGREPAASIQVNPPIWVNGTKASEAVLMPNADRNTFILVVLFYLVLKVTGSPEKIITLLSFWRAFRCYTVMFTSLSEWAVLCKNLLNHHRNTVDLWNNGLLKKKGVKQSLMHVAVPKM